MRISYIILLTLFTTVINGQSVIGKWKTIDDETGKEKSIIELYEIGGEVFGRVIKIIDPELIAKNVICDECDDDDDRKDKGVVGMEIIRNMKLDGNEYNDGTILDPGNGEVYSCKLWIDEEDENILRVRGYIAVFYRTQTWYRVE